MQKLFFIVLLYSLSLFEVVAQSKLIPITNGDNWGYCDENMNLVIPFQFDQAYPFFEERALVINYDYDGIDSGKYFFVQAAFINPKGETVFSLHSIPEANPASRFQNGLALVENYNQKDINDEKSLSVVDKWGKELQRIKGVGLGFDLSMYYENGKPFDSYGIYASTEWENGNVTLVYEDGRAAISTNYMSVSPFRNALALAIGEYIDSLNTNETYIVDTNGVVQVLKSGCLFSSDYDNGNVVSDNLICFKKGDKYGFMNLSAEVIIEPIFDLAQPFSQGLAVVGQAYDALGPYGPTQYYKYGYIDTLGRLKVPYQYDYASPFSEGLAEVVQISSNKEKAYLLFIDKEGKQKIQLDFKAGESGYDLNYPFDSYVYPHGFKNGRAIYFDGEKVGFINRNGEIIIPPLYYGLGRIGPSTIVEPFENGLTKLQHPDSYGYGEIYIDTTGRQYFRPKKTVLPNFKKTIRSYSEADETKVLGTVKFDGLFTPVSISPKKAKRGGQKGYWMEGLSREGKQYFVFSTDFNTNSLLTTALKGANLYIAPDVESAEIAVLAPNTILFLHEESSRIGASNWLGVYYYDLSDSENHLKVGYIMGSNIKKQSFGTN